jgi:hypothetical protein
MELEQFVTGRFVVRQRIIPTAGVPPPFYSLIIQPVTEGNCLSGCEDPLSGDGVW